MPRNNRPSPRLLLGPAGSVHRYIHSRNLWNLHHEMLIFLPDVDDGTE